MAAGGEARLFRFAQFEFPWLLGPEPGRYVLRKAGEQRPGGVLVLSTLGAAERRRLGRCRARGAEPEPDPSPVPTTRVTLIDAEPLDAAPEAERWLAQARGEHAEERLEQALGSLNAVLRVQRAAAADPSVHAVTREQALVARLGYGAGEQVADGRWSEAVEVAWQPARRRRTAALVPQERLATILGGRDAVLACEELTLRARSDLDAGHAREAALQLRIALEAALAELEAEPGMADRVEELHAERRVVGEAANAALRGPLAPDLAGEVQRILGRLEAALRARRAA